MPKLLGMTQSGFDPASWFRFIQFIPHLEKAGWTVEHRPNRPDRQWYSTLRPRLARALHYRAGRLVMKANRLRDAWAARGFDVLFVNRDLAAEGRCLRQFFASAIRRSVFDFDDAIFTGRMEPTVRWLCANAAWVTPGNEYLAAYARRHAERVTIIPTVIDTDRYVPRNYELPGRDGPVRVGWSGSDQSIQTTLGPHLDLLRKLQAVVPFELVVITNSRPQLPDAGLRWTFIPWKREEEPFLETHLDIGIMPLVNDAFQKGKCGLKLLQYMAAGLPTVASPVGVNAEILLPGATGLWATTELEWHRALEILIRKAELRAALGRAGRKRCEEHYSIRRWLPVLLDLFNRVAQRNR